MWSALLEEGGIFGGEVLGEIRDYSDKRDLREKRDGLQGLGGVEEGFDEIG